MYAAVGIVLWIGLLLVDNEGSISLNLLAAFADGLDVRLVFIGRILLRECEWIDYDCIHSNLLRDLKCSLLYWNLRIPSSWHRHLVG